MGVAVLQPCTGERELLDSSRQLPTGIVVSSCGIIYVSGGGSTSAGELLSFTPP